MNPRIVVLDYGSGNLRSALRALQRAGADAEVTADFEAAANADGLVVPGVGAYAACMAGLRAVRGEEIIAKRLADGRPVLGICVGMQVMFALGVEHGEQVPPAGQSMVSFADDDPPGGRPVFATPGCGVWPGTVDRLTAPVLPHMGWNTVQAPAGSALFAGIGPDERFYFVHSYAVRTWDPASQALVTWAEHGEPFAAAVEDGQACATQFHPEKSGDAGAKLLSNWLELIR